MRRSTGFSAFLSLLRAGSAGAAVLALSLSCSDMTGPKDRMPDGVTVVWLNVSDSAKSAYLQGVSANVLTTPTGISADLLVPSGAAGSSSVGNFKYVVSQPSWSEPEAIPTIIIPQDSVPNDGFLKDIPLGFNFDFFGTTYDKVNVASNGFLVFGAVPTDPFRTGFMRGDQIPNAAVPNNMIAFAWTDWEPRNVYGGIRFETRGTAPHRRFLLQFNNVPEYSANKQGKGLLMMQLVLTEGSNEITIYTNTMSITKNTQLITQGVENADGTAAAFGSFQDSTGVWHPRVRNVFSLTNDIVHFAPPRPPVVSAPRDTSLPTASPSAGGSRLAATSQLGTCDALVNPGIATATGDFPIVSIVGVRSDDPALPLEGRYPKGVTTITWTATDSTGLKASALQKVTVLDTENPLLSAPQSIIADNDPHLPSALVAVGSATAADNCPDVTVSNVRSDGAPISDPFMVGVTTITWKAADASGNISSAQQSITVRDVEPPTLSVPNPITVNATSPSGALVAYQLTATDNVAVTLIACTPLSGTTFPIGSTSVACTASDAAGNKKSGSFDVNVVDAPTQEQSLIKYILALGLPDGVTNPLINQLIAAFDSSHDVSCIKMNDFVNLVLKKSRDLTPESASYMIRAAQQIIAVLACPNPRGHPQQASTDYSG